MKQCGMIYDATTAADAAATPSKLPQKPLAILIRLPRNYMYMYNRVT